MELDTYQSDRRHLMRSLGDLGQSLRPTVPRTPILPRSSAVGAGSNPQTPRQLHLLSTNEEVSGWDCQQHDQHPRERIFQLSSNLQVLQSNKHRAETFEKKLYRSNYSENSTMKDFADSIKRPRLRGKSGMKSATQLVNSAKTSYLNSIQTVLQQLTRPSTAEAKVSTRYHPARDLSEEKFSKEQGNRSSNLMNARKETASIEHSKLFSTVVHKAFPCRKKMLRRVGACINFSFGAAFKKMRRAFPQRDPSCQQFSDANLYHAK